MLFDLPTGPEIHLIGPDDTAVWTALDVEASGRHAVVIGDLATPARATIIAGLLADIATYLDPLSGPLTRALARVGAQARQPSLGRVRREAIPAGGNIEDQPAVELLTLPHTGVRVPDPRLRVTSYRELPTPEGVAYTATLRLGRIPVGTTHNEGTGGPTSFHPVAESPFGWRQLAVFVAASRTCDGHPIEEEQLLDELITEYEHAKEVSKAARVGRVPLRLRSPLGYDEHLADAYYTAQHAMTTKVTTSAQRAALVADLLAHAPLQPGQWWQMWNGEQWENLTPPPPEQPVREQP